MKRTVSKGGGLSVNVHTSVALQQLPTVQLSCSSVEEIAVTVKNMGWIGAGRGEAVGGRGEGRVGRRGEGQGCEHSTLTADVVQSQIAYPTTHHSLH